MPEVLDYDDRFVTLQGADGGSFRTNRDTAEKLFPSLEFDAQPPAEFDDFDAGGVDLFPEMQPDSGNPDEVMGLQPEPEPVGPGGMVDLDAGQPVPEDGPIVGGDYEPPTADDLETGPKYPKVGMREGFKKAGDLQSRSFERRERGITEGAVAKSGGLEEMGDARNDGEKDVQRIRQSREALRLEREEKEVQLAKGYEEQIDKRLNAKLDRGRYWSKMSTSRKVMSFVGILLNATGNALEGEGGAPNQALSMLMKAVSDDVEDQKSEIGKLGQDVAIRKGLLKDYRDSTKTKMGEFNLQMAERLEQVKRQILTITDRTNSQVAKARGKELLGVLDGEIAGYYRKTAQGELNARIAARRAAAAAHAARQRAAYKMALDRDKSKLAWHKASQEDRKIAQSKAAAGAKAVASGNIFDPGTGRPIPTIRDTDGNIIGGRDPKLPPATREVVKDANVRLKGWKAYDRLLREYKTLIDGRKVYRGPGGSLQFIKGQRAVDLDNMLDALATARARMMNGARMSDADVEVAARIVGKARGYLSRAAIGPGLERESRLGRKSVEDALQSSGYLVRDKAGKPIKGTPTYDAYIRDKTQGGGPAPESKVEKLTKDAISPDTKAAGIHSPKMTASKELRSLTRLHALAKSGDSAALSALKAINKETRHEFGSWQDKLIKKAIKDGEAGAKRGAIKTKTKRTSRRSEMAVIQLANSIRKKGPKSRKWFNFMRSKKLQDALRAKARRGEKLPSWAGSSVKVHESK